MLKAESRKMLVVLSFQLSALSLLASCSHGSRIVVASKNFTEQDILGEIVAQQIERTTHLPVERRFHLGGTFVCHQALVAGQADLYVEYTGTALVAVLKQPVTSNADSALARVRAAYDSQFHVTWLAPLGFNNTFAMVVRQSTADSLPARTLSAAAPYARHWRGGFGYEFIERGDGFPGLSRAYGLTLSGPPTVMDLGLTYRALADGKVDLIAGNSTDGQIAALHLVALEDDRHYFPPYQAAPVVRDGTLRRHPDLRAALDGLAGTISDSTMRQMNYEVDVEHRDIKAVASAFLDGLSAARAARR